MSKVHRSPFDNRFKNWRALSGINNETRSTISNSKYYFVAKILELACKLNHAKSVSFIATIPLQFRYYHSESGLMRTPKRSLSVQQTDKNKLICWTTNLYLTSSWCIQLIKRKLHKKSISSQHLDVMSVRLWPLHY